MKKTKFAVLFTAVMAVLGLSSCLGDPDPYNTSTEIMKIDGFSGFYSFKSMYGYVVNPTNSEALQGTFDNGSFAYVSYKYDTRNITQGATNIDAEIQYLLPIGEINRSYGEYTESNAPMKSVSLTVIPFYDKTNMFIDLTYYYIKSANTEEQSNELGKHHFYLYKATAENDEDVDDKTMVLNLIHMVDDTDNNEKRTSAGTETRHVNLSYFLEGSEPEKIIIKFKQASNSSLENANDEKIEIEYKSIMDQYFNNSSSM